MKIYHVLLQSIVLVSPALARGNPGEVSNTTPPPPSPPQPPSITHPPASPAPPPRPSVSVPAPAPNSPKCGKGYTYCGYLLTGNGHNFQPSDVTKAYCSGLPERCPSGKPRTDAAQAVYYCLNDQPSQVRLLCACSGKCLNNPETNHIAHCDKPCVNT